MESPANKKSSTTRRTFLQTGSMAVLGMTLPGHAAASAPTETLAISGGPKTVTFPKDKLDAMTRWPRYGEAEKRALHALIDNNKFYDELPAFEKEWKDYTQSPFVKAHMNGSSAITSMLFALDLPPGSEILLPSYNFFTDCLAMRFFGYVPVFVDINPHTATFDLEDAKRKVTTNTRALFPMHSFGMPCELDHICDFAKEKGFLMIEDAAHGHGASMQGKKLGTWGVMGIYSFQASKVLPAVEGGMGLYQTREYYERAAAFGHYEAPETFPADSPVRAYTGTGFGQKYRMHPFAAAVARQQLRGLDERNGFIEANVRKLNDRITQLPGLSEPRLRSDQKRAYYFANMLLLDPVKAGFSRDALVKALEAEGVRIHTWQYPEQHKLKIYSEAKWWHHTPIIPTSMPGTDSIQQNHIFMPLLYDHADEVIDQWAKAFEKVWAHRSELTNA